MSEYERMRFHNFANGPFRYVHVEDIDAIDDLLGRAAEAASHTLAKLPQRPEGSYPGETGPLAPEPDDDPAWDPSEEGAIWMVDPYQN